MTTYCKAHVYDGPSMVRGLANTRRCLRAPQYDGLCPLHARQAGIAEALADFANKPKPRVWVVVGKRADGSETERYVEGKTERGAKQAFARLAKIENLTFVGFKP